MLSRTKRLTTEQLNLVMQKGGVKHSPLFVIRWMIIPIDQKKKITTPIKYAAVAPNKIFKTAVLRNHTRRKIYEAIYKAENTISESVEPKNQLYIALFAKATITDVDFETLTKNTRDVLSSFFPKV